jgi:hypothetical protein
VPLSALFGLKLGLNVPGFWLGLLCTTYSMSAVQLLIIACFNWTREVERAAALIASHADEAADAKAAVLGAAAAAAPVTGQVSGGVLEGPDSVRVPDVWAKRTSRVSKDSSGRHSRHQQQQAVIDQERVSLLAGAAGANDSSGLSAHGVVAQQQHVMQHQASLQRGLLQSCDSIDR